MSKRSGPPAAPVGREPWLSLAASALGIMMVGIDGTVVAIANPAIGQDLHATLSSLQWVTNSYLLVLAAALITAGKLGDRYGRKRMFLIGLGGFAAASVAVGLSPSIGLVVAARAVQGLFGALLMPNSLAILRASFPEETLERAVGIWSGVSATAVAAGPVVGGVVVQHLSWQAVFFLNVPVAVVAIPFARRYVTESREHEITGRFDALGVALLAGAMASLVWGVIRTQATGWGAAGTDGFLVGGAVLLALFLAHERSAEEPVMPLGLFRIPSVAAGTALVVLVMFCLFGTLFFVTLYLESTHGLSPTRAGVYLLPLTAIFSISSPIVGHIGHRVGNRVLIVTGVALMGVSFLGLSRLEPTTSYLGMAPWFATVGLGIGLVLVSATHAVVSSVSVDEAGIASGIQGTGIQLGGVIGTSVLGSVMATAVASSLRHTSGVPAAAAARLAGLKAYVAQGLVPRVPGASAVQTAAVSHTAFVHGLHVIMLLGAVVAVAACACGLFVTDSEAVPTAAVLI